MITVAEFGHLADGRVVKQFTLSNSDGVSVELINYGGALVKIEAPDRQGRLGDVVLGYDTLAGYESDRYFLGSLIGRVANRIRDGRCQLQGQALRLPLNSETQGVGCHLHGGDYGFHKVLWQVEALAEGNNDQVVLTYFSEAGEQGYPGNLSVVVVYRLTKDNALEVDYRATTDQTTLVNLTQHSYFNLSANPSQAITDHHLQLYASRYAALTPGLIPSGELCAVEGTPLDFRQAKAIGRDLDAAVEQLQWPGGFDHYFVLDDSGDMATPATEEQLQSAARVAHPATGRCLEVMTNQPGLQFYSGNHFPSAGSGQSCIGKRGLTYRPNSGFCLEAHGYPDAPNQPDFPDILLRPGEHYHAKTVYRFGVTAE